MGTVFRQENADPSSIGDVFLLQCYEKYIAEVKNIFGKRPPSLDYSDATPLNCTLSLNSGFGRIVKGVPGDGMEVNLDTISSLFSIV